MTKKWIVLLTLICCGSTARAVTPVLDINLFYFTDDFTYDSTASAYSRTMWDVMVGMPITKKGRWVLGWNYASYSLSENPGSAETELTITDMGPKILVYIDRDRLWALGLTYNLIGRADYTASGTTSELRGTSLKAEFGYLPMMWENVFMGAKLNYYKADFKEEITGESSLEQVTHSRAVIYPTFAITIRWD